jgi:hypothetical protein
LENWVYPNSLLRLVVSLVSVVCTGMTMPVRTAAQVDGLAGRALTVCKNGTSFDALVERVESTPSGDGVLEALVV